MKGYKEALAENGLSYNEGLVFESEYKFKAALIWLSVSVIVGQLLPLLQMMS